MKLYAHRQDKMYIISTAPLEWLTRRKEWKTGGISVDIKLFTFYDNLDEHRDIHRVLGIHLEPGEGPVEFEVIFPNRS